MAWIIGKVYHVWRYEGTKAVILKSVQHLMTKKAKGDILKEFRFVLGDIKYQESGSPAGNTEKVLNWIVPDLGAPGAGGHLNICRCIAYLAKYGYKSRIYFFNVMGNDTRAGVKDLYDKYYADVAGHAEIYSAHYDPILPAAAVVATSWETAYLVKILTNCHKKFYFVQDYEPWFFPQGSVAAMAEATYRFGFIGITASPWLKEKLEKGYQMPCYAYGFSYDKTVYYPRERKSKQQQVFLYARPNTGRRAFEIAVLALTLVHKKMPQVEFVFAGGNISLLFEIPFPFKDKGIVTWEQLAQFYSDSDICMVLSCSNISLLPLEIMGCKSVVLSNDDEQVKWLLTDQNAILVHNEPQALADAICEYLQDPQKLEKLRQNGYEYAIKTSWDNEYEKVLQCLDKEMH